MGMKRTVHEMTNCLEASGSGVYNFAFWMIEWCARQFVGVGAFELTPKWHQRAQNKSIDSQRSKVTKGIIRYENNVMDVHKSTKKTPSLPPTRWEKNNAFDQNVFTLLVQTISQPHLTANACVSHPYALIGSFLVWAASKLISSPIVPICDMHNLTICSNFEFTVASYKRSAAGENLRS